jgi:dTDP-4-dehydrorhamnose 3,5-epimerase
MKFQETALKGAFVVDLSPFRDDRGQFARTFCMRAFREMGLAEVFVQTNHVRTARRGTIRGLHYQAPPAAEAKLVRCVRGAIQDVMIDLRRGSPTFLRWHSEVLSEENQRMVYAPPGFAHGFQTLEADSEATYQVSAFYTPRLEGCVRYDDPLVKVQWMVPEAILSPKDAGCPLLTPEFRGLEL